MVWELLSKKFEGEEFNDSFLICVQCCKICLHNNSGRAYWQQIPLVQMPLTRLVHPPAAARGGCSQLTAGVSSSRLPLVEESHLTWGYLGGYALHPWDGVLRTDLWVKHSQWYNSYCGAPHGIRFQQKSYHCLVFSPALTCFLYFTMGFSWECFLNKSLAQEFPSYFCRNRKIHPKIPVESQGTLKSQNNLEKYEQNWCFHTSWFQNLVQSNTNHAV